MKVAVSIMMFGYYTIMESVISIKNFGHTQCAESMQYNSYTMVGIVCFDL